MTKGGSLESRYSKLVSPEENQWKITLVCPLKFVSGIRGLDACNVRQVITVTAPNQATAINLGDNSQFNCSHGKLKMLGIPSPHFQ